MAQSLSFSMVLCFVTSIPLIFLQLWQSRQIIIWLKIFQFNSVHNCCCKKKMHTNHQNLIHSARDKQLDENTKNFQDLAGYANSFQLFPLRSTKCSSQRKTAHIVHFNLYKRFNIFMRLKRTLSLNVCCVKFCLLMRLQYKIDGMS